jgi:phage-related protein (TIGR01555 family)
MKTSIKAAARDAKREDAKLRKGSPLVTGATADSFVNFAHKLGIGSDNVLSSGTYGYNPITRNRTLLEWIHRGSWLGGVAVDLIADDMTRAGIDVLCEMEPDDVGAIERAAATLNIWPQINETIRWARLYGGCLGVLLVDGQDPKTPLRPETVGKEQFKGLLTLDRWMVDPSLEDLITDYGPSLGLPKYYKVQSNAPALRGQVIHHSRVAYRLTGIELPYQQRLTETLWGISVLERLYDRMIAFDSASTGAAQLVFKSYLRTLKIDGLRDIVAAGGAPLNGLMQYTEIMRRFQGVEGITMLDLTDEFEVQSTSAFSGVDAVLLQLGQQLSGALQIPLVRLFGQSPAGLNSTGESDIRSYYDRISNDQNKTLLTGTTMVYRLTAQSEGIKPPDDFSLGFKSLWQLDAVQKADVASKNAEAVTKANEGGLIGRQTSLKELRQSSRVTGVFTNITSEMIDAADDEVLPPDAELAMQQEHEEGMLEKGHEHATELAEQGHEHASELADKGAKTALALAKTKAKENKNAGPQGNKRKVADGARRRVLLQH